MRTWKQRILEVIEYGKELERLDVEDSGPEKRAAFIEKKLAGLHRRVGDKDPSLIDSFQRAQSDRRYVRDLCRARDIVFPLFRRLEALRVTLPKHEIPKTPRVRAWAPGYARIDSSSYMLCWFVETKSGSTEIISRQSLVDGCRRIYKSLAEETRTKTRVNRPERSSSQ